MPRFHINDKGEPGQCRAEKNCPFGLSDGEHYTTKEEARKAYENQQSSFTRKLDSFSSRIQGRLPEELSTFEHGSEERHFDRVAVSWVVARDFDSKTDRTNIVEVMTPTGRLTDQKLLKIAGFLQKLGGLSEEQWSAIPDESRIAWAKQHTTIWEDVTVYPPADDENGVGYSHNRGSGGAEMYLYDDASRKTSTRRKTNVDLLRKVDEFRKFDATKVEKAMSKKNHTVLQRVLDGKKTNDKAVDEAVESLKKDSLKTTLNNTTYLVNKRALEILEAHRGDRPNSLSTPDSFDPSKETVFSAKRDKITRSAVLKSMTRDVKHIQWIEHLRDLGIADDDLQIESNIRRSYDLEIEQTSARLIAKTKEVEYLAQTRPEFKNVFRKLDHSLWENSRSTPIVGVKDVS